MPDRPAIDRSTRARLILAGLLIVLALGLLPSGQAPRVEKPPADRGDAILHQATIDRLRAGDGYYVAVGDQLRQQVYPATQVFNWRTPAHFEMVAAMSVPIATAVLHSLVVAVLLLLPFAFARESSVALLVLILGEMGALATPMTADAVVFAEVWAGVLIALSLCAYYSKRWTAGALFGVMAVFMREIAGPYCLACGLAALAAKRRREATIWIVAGVGYAIYFGVHAAQVWAHQQPGDLAQAESWVRWNGLAFTFATIKANGWLALAPHWTTVLFTILGLAGATSSRTPQQVKVSIGMYLVLFAVAGQGFNYYWGFVNAPIWAFAAANGIQGLRDLVHTAALHTSATIRSPDPPMQSM